MRGVGRPVSVRGKDSRFFSQADFSSDPRAVPVQLQTTGLLGAAAAQRAGKKLGTGGHAMGGDPSKVTANVFCTAPLNRPRHRRYQPWKVAVLAEHASGRA